MSRRPGYLQKGRHGTPVPRPAGDQVEVRRAPVFDERRPRVPALPPIDRLDVALAPRASRDEIRFVGAAGFEAREIARPVGAAQRTAHAREEPRPAAEMAAELEAAVL